MSQKLTVSSQPGFVDIHCHLLPGIDDGAQSWEDSLAMARMAVADGIATIVTTPHQLGAFAHNTGDAIRSRTVELQSFLSLHEVPLAVLPGADVRIEANLTALLRSGEVLTLADQRRHVLLELPHEMYVPLERLLRELRGVGIVGILSHPERNQGILSDASIVRELVDGGCLMQVTAGSLTGAFGPHVQRFTETLVQDGLVHFVSTDAHNLRSRKPVLSAAYQRVVELVGLEMAEELCRHNPGAVATGASVVAGRRNVVPMRRTRWFGWKKAA